MATIAVSQQGHRDYLERHIEVAQSLKQKAEELAGLQARVTEKQALVNGIGDRVRAGLVDKVPALDGSLEAQLTDIELERDGNGDIVAIHTNAEAATYRAGA